MLKSIGGDQYKGWTCKFTETELESKLDETLQALVPTFSDTICVFDILNGPDAETIVSNLVKTQGTLDWITRNTAFCTDITEFKDNDLKQKCIKLIHYYQKKFPRKKYNLLHSILVKYPILRALRPSDFNKQLWTFVYYWTQISEKSQKRLSECWESMRK